MTKSRIPLYFVVLTVFALALAACQSAAPAPQPTAVPPTAVPTEAAAEPAMTPSVTVSDQEIADGTVTVAEVVSNGAGWIVVHAQADGKPGPILGYAPVSDGANKDVSVQIDASKATQTLYAMLHTDAGEAGAFEFPNGPDGPVQVDGKVVTPAFEVSIARMPSVTVSDQDIADGTVTVAEVVSNGAGWIVIHAQADGKPGPILGYAPVSDGVNKDVSVQIDASKATQTLYAMLHTDAGEAGTFEFPNGPDGPVKVDGKVVTPAFDVSLMQGSLINVGEKAGLGTFLTDAKGMTLYIFLNDEPGKSNCYNGCAQNWPPLLTEDAPVAGESVDASLLGTTERTDGSTQVTYNGYPLYYWVHDAVPGDTNGQGVKDVWFVISPTGEIIK